MPLFGSSSRSATTNLITDNRVAASDQAAIVKADGGSTINIGGDPGTVLSPVLNFARDALSSQKTANEAALSEVSAAASGGAASALQQVVPIVLIAGAIWAAVRIFGS